MTNTRIAETANNLLMSINEVVSRETSRKTDKRITTRVLEMWNDEWKTQATFSYEEGATVTGDICLAIRGMLCKSLLDDKTAEECYKMCLMILSVISNHGTINYQDYNDYTVR